MKDSDFKNVMSKIPTSVSILVQSDEEKTVSCTISSLVSVSINNPKVLFVLKKESKTGWAIETNRFFEIFVLTSEQEEAAKKSSTLNHHLSTADIHQLKISSRIVMECELYDVHENYEAKVYIATVLNAKIRSDGNSLIYLNREFRAIE